MLNLHRLPASATLVLSLALGLAAPSAAQRASGLSFGFPEPGSGAAGDITAIADFGPGVGGAYRQLVADPTTWQRWWQLHREEFLELDGPGSIAGRIRSDASPDRVGGLPVDAGVVDHDVIPRLEALFLDPDGSDELRATGLLAAARLSAVTRSLGSKLRVAREDRLEQLLRQALGSPAPELHEAGLYGLGLVGSPSTLSLLGQLALDQPGGRELLRNQAVPLRSRAVAAYALGLAAHNAARPSLRSYAVHQLEMLLDEDDVNNADLGTAVVLSLGLAAGEGERDRGDELDMLIVRLLDRWESGELQRAVAERLPTTIGRLAVFAEAEVQERTVAALLDTLEDHSAASAPTRRAAVLALGQVGDADQDEQDVRIRAALTKALASRDALLRRYSALSLARAGSRTDGPAEQASEGAADVAETLLDHLAAGRSADRPWTALALGVFGHHARKNRLTGPAPKVEAGLASTLRRNRSSDQRPALAIAAALAGAQQARSTIERDLKRADGDESKGLFALSLGLLGEKQALSSLRRAASDTHSRPNLRVDLALARAMLGDPGLVSELLDQVEECNCWSSTLGSTTALARVGDSQALGVLLAKIRDAASSDRERALAAQALGWMASGDGAPWSTPLTVGLDPLGAPGTLTEPSGTGVLDRL